MWSDSWYVPWMRQGQYRGRERSGLGCAYGHVFHDPAGGCGSGKE